MLKRLVLKNFKIHQRLELELAQVTLLIGPQGVGKSTVLDALYLLAQSAEQGQPNYRATRLKGLEFRDIVYRREERNLIEFRLSCDFPGAFPPVTDGPCHSVEYALVLDSAGFREHTAEYSFPEGFQWQFRTPRAGKWTVPAALQYEGRPRVDFRGSTLICIPFVFLQQGVDYPLHRNLMQLRGELADYLRELHLVRTGRELMDAAFPVQEKVQAPFATTADAINWLARSWDHRDVVSEWSQRIVGRRIAVRQAGDQLLVEAADGLGAPHLITNEGSGLRQLIWPLSALASARSGSLVAVEEPEIHLHPAAQSRLCTLLCEVASEQGKQLMLTTHSEHIVVAFLTEVAQQHISPEQLAIYHFSESAEGMVAVERVEVDDRGMTKRGLRGFFEAGLDELVRYLDALAGGSGQ